MKHQGFEYDFTPREAAYLLFRKKICPKCGNRLHKKKRYETLKGSELNSKADPIFVQNANVKHYLYFFTCQQCGAEYTLNELAK